ncbi:5'-methylthioadenosine/S-adenosylhomocysteine nucleosidase [Acinetobacter sp. MD2(2019)]|uniref:5'-methylthioadenosine/S-adenosylhomocysteine nucleosidase n=1 Tax=Acinetobacter sp. MD2(2019) TaxID=2605273 RepID=UPI002D1F5342|nr:5'-methylthioadenosine/S-adenosylhomocysteine nucleosidase [Acinetobacter sp. MD2(2019)]MEB3754298.1 5'-methylthioadenosine/S-adenosylhomocysteine nucleosidase [Acinetobacter sp. MD2(2019)]
MRLLKLSLLLGAVGLTAGLVGCATTTTLQKSTAPKLNQDVLTDATPRLAIIAAFGQEADLLIQSTQDKHEYMINGRKFVTGQLENTPVVITLSGISMTNAAMTTQMIADHFKLKGIVFSGIAGSLNPNYHVGDVVIAKNWIAPNEVYFNNNSTLPNACGKAGDISCLGIKLADNVPAWKNQFLRETNVMNATNYKNVALTSRFGDTDVPMAYGEMRVDFPVDSKMLNIVNKVQADTQTQLEAICAGANCYNPKIVIGNRGVSGGAFLANAEYRDYLNKNLKGDCVDMETAAVAQVAYSNNIPFIAFRSLSDLAGADHDPNVAAFFGSGIAQRNAAKLTMAFIKEWNAEQ